MAMHRHPTDRNESELQVPETTFKAPAESGIFCPQSREPLKVC